MMGNHYHLMIETPEANLIKGMRHSNGVFTQWFNRRHKRSGHLFQGRYNAILIERDSCFLELARYIVLNPVRAAMVKHPTLMGVEQLRSDDRNLPSSEMA
ncbi:MAG TPA: transposase [Candidatus Polarisedimenticolaceae bacterium]|nr:transposase [Candidatus Polarisedimenticolaceae bacterium]